MSTTSLIGSFVRNARGWFGAGEAVGSVTPVDAAPAPAKPDTGVEGGSSAYVYGSAGSSGWGFLSGYGECPPNGPSAWLDALRHPTLAMARAFALNPILAGKWKFRPGTLSGEDAERAERETKPLVAGYVRDARWSVDLGWAGFQNVWERDGRRFVLKKVIACQQEVDSGVIVDQGTGELLGVRWNGTELYGHKGFVLTNDRRGQQWLGRSRVANVIDSVSQWRQLNDKTCRLANKAAGIVAGVGFPPGTATDAAGAKVSRQKQATDFGKQITSGAGFFTYPLLGALSEERLLKLLDTNPEAIAKLLELTLWKLNVIDLGDQGPAMLAVTADKRYLDELICMGYHVAPESILMGAGGNRAKTESQGNSSTAVNEEVNVNICATFNDGPMNSYLTLNGHEGSGAGWDPEPLEDTQPMLDRQLLGALAASDGGRDYLLRRFDIDAIAERNGMGKRPEPLTDEELPPPVAAQGRQANGENGDEEPGQTNGKPVNGFHNRVVDLLAHMG